MATTATASASIQPSGGFLQAKGICKTFRSKQLVVPVLQDISLTVAPGEFVAVLGPSGCGKSTLLEILCGLQQPDSGEVLINGVVTTDPGQVAYMPQRSALLPWRNIIDNVTLGPALRAMPRNAARQRALEYMELFGLNGFGASYPRELSGGMQQRAALLRTYLSGHAIMALDEPFGALDAITRQEMQEWLAQVQSNIKATIIMVTHDIEEAILLADRVYILTARPATVGCECTVDLPCPRDTMSTAFTEYKAKLRAALRR